MEETKLATIQPTTLGFSTVEGFTGLQRVAKALSSSPIVPEAYRGETGLASCLIALDIAARAGVSPLVVMQNLHVIQGKPSFSAQYLIAQAAAAGHPITWKVEKRPGKVGGIADMTVTATMHGIPGAEYTVDSQLAVDEGWSAKNGSKYKTMPELMLRYRSAAFLVRLYLPHVSLGLPTEDEIIDVHGEEPSKKATPRRNVIDVESTVVAESEEGSL